jgi:tetratricopeptide (TPR) repeat protein
MATAVAAIVVIVAIAAALVRARDAAIFARHQVIAVGTITDYAASDSSGIARALRDMLATNLARSPDLSVVSGSRLLEVEREMTGGKSSAPGEIVPVARQAGATTLVDGTLYSVAGDTLRFDLRVTRLRDGSLLRAITVTGRDPFALADSATTHLVRYLGSTVPRGSVADGTTHSVAAYRFYEEGLRSYYLGDATSSEPLFAAALAQDSTFAMAAYYYALASRGNRVENVKRLRRAVNLASRANERDRLIIQGGWALTNSLRSLRAIAETLVTRYPTEVDGHYLLGIAVVNAGTYLEAIPSLRRVEALDSLTLVGRSARCAACDALAVEVSAYMSADSQAAAERAVRRWLAARPNEWRPWAVLGAVLTAAGRGDEARIAIRKSDSLDFRAEAWEAMATLLMREGRFTEADEILRNVIAKGGADAPSAHWFLAISLRYQGRPAEALGNARAYRRAAAAIEHVVPGAVDPSGMGEAQVLRELGRYKEAAALFDSVSRFNVPGSDASADASARIWGLTHEAGALAAGGDTSRLAPLADSIGAFGAVTNLVRDSQLYHHVRGLLLAARGADGDAVMEFRQAITSPTLGYTRSNVEMARSLLRLRRYREAVSILEPAMRGGIQSGNFYTTYPEIRLLLAEAYAGAGQHDRANRELDWVRRAWVNADPNIRPQLDSVARIVAKH